MNATAEAYKQFVDEAQSSLAEETTTLIQSARNDIEPELDREREPGPEPQEVAE